MFKMPDGAQGRFMTECCWEEARPVRLGEFSCPGCGETRHITPPDGWSGGVVIFIVRDERYHDTPLAELRERFAFFPTPAGGGVG